MNAGDCRIRCRCVEGGTLQSTCRDAQCSTGAFSRRLDPSLSTLPGGNVWFPGFQRRAASRQEAQSAQASSRDAAASLARSRGIEEMMAEREFVTSTLHETSSGLPESVDTGDNGTPASVRRLLDRSLQHCLQEPVGGGSGVRAQGREIVRTRTGAGTGTADARAAEEPQGCAGWSAENRIQASGATPSAAAASFRRRSRLASAQPSWIASAR